MSKGALQKGKKSELRSNVSHNGCIWFPALFNYLLNQSFVHSGVSPLVLVVKTRGLIFLFLELTANHRRMTTVNFSQFFIPKMQFPSKNSAIQFTKSQILPKSLRFLKATIYGYISQKWEGEVGIGVNGERSPVLPTLFRTLANPDSSKDVNRAATAFHAVRFWKILPRTSRAAEMSIGLDLDWTGSGLWRILLNLEWI